MPAPVVAGGALAAAAIAFASKIDPEQVSQWIEGIYKQFRRWRGERAARKLLEAILNDDTVSEEVKKAVAVLVATWGGSSDT